MIGVIKYGAGNVKSVMACLARLNQEAVLTDDPDVLSKCDRVIFPGVGEASSAMANLREKGLVDVIRNLKQPFLGICLGMQLMCRTSEEGNADCLGIFDVDVKRFPDSVPKIPHMGWNSISSRNKEIDGKDFYFVHSFYVPMCEWTYASCSYHGEFSAMLRKDNFLCCQFHPEKSGDAGARLMKQFLEM